MQADTSSAYIGLSVIDLQSNTAFMNRPLRDHHATDPLEVIGRLSDSLSESSESFLASLTRAALEICGADSAVIHAENDGAGEADFYEWVAAAGVYAKHLHTTFPRHPSACGICLKRGTPQLFRISREFFDRLGKDVDVVTDGILLPWSVERMRGVFFIAAHSREEAFDYEDFRVLQLLAKFAAADFRRRDHHSRELAEARAEGAAAMAVDVAREISAPLKTMQAIAHLTQRSRSSVEAKLFAEELNVHMDELMTLCRKLSRTRRRPANTKLMDR